MFCIRESCIYHFNRDHNEECLSCVMDSNYTEKSQEKNQRRQHMKDGGPAFPVIGSQMGSGVEYPGISLRDYFAAKAMEGDWASQSNTIGVFDATTSDECFIKRARLYYRAAAAMLAAREATC